MVVRAHREYLKFDEKQKKKIDSNIQCTNEGLLSIFCSVCAVWCECHDPHHSVVKWNDGEGDVVITTATTFRFYLGTTVSTKINWISKRASGEKSIDSKNKGGQITVFSFIIMTMAMAMAMVVADFIQFSIHWLAMSLETYENWFSFNFTRSNIIRSGTSYFVLIFLAFHFCCLFGNHELANADEGIDNYKSAEHIRTSTGKRRNFSIWSHIFIGKVSLCSIRERTGFNSSCLCSSFMSMSSLPSLQFATLLTLGNIIFSLFELVRAPSHRRYNK